jgi:hypothetical protein
MYRIWIQNKDWNSVETPDPNPDPDPLVRDMDPDPRVRDMDPDPNPSIIK